MGFFARTPQALSLTRFEDYRKGINGILHRHANRLSWLEDIMDSLTHGVKENTITGNRHLAETDELTQRVALLEARVDMLDAAEDAELQTEIEELLMGDDEWCRQYLPATTEMPVR